MLKHLLRSATRAFSHDDMPNHTEGIEERFLTDQQRIIRLLSGNDGKMWQRGMIEETGWSASKISRTLSAMEKEGRIVRLQIGRQNLVTLPERTEFGQGRTSG